MSAPRAAAAAAIRGAESIIEETALWDCFPKGGFLCALPGGIVFPCRETECIPCRGDEVCAPSGGGGRFSFQGNTHLCAKSRPPGDCAPKRRCDGRHPGLGMGALFWKYHSFVGDVFPSLLLKCTPLFFFSMRGEKEERRARWRRKRGLLKQTCG